MAANPVLTQLLDIVGMTVICCMGQLATLSQAKLVEDRIDASPWCESGGAPRPRLVERGLHLSVSYERGCRQPIALKAYASKAPSS